MNLELRMEIGEVQSELKFKVRAGSPLRTCEDDNIREFGNLGENVDDATPPNGYEAQVFVGF